MTWIVGTRIVFGYAVGISDVRVTWETGRREDCLQKIYEVGRFVAAGFAGSVEIGFVMINDLRSVLSGLPADEAWIPRWVALKWWRRARRIYNHYPNVPAKQLGCSIILIGVSPQLVPGQEWPRSDIITMKSQNDFVPKTAQPSEALSVGSGGNVERYVKWLNEFMADSFPYMQGEVNNPGGMGQSIASEMSMLVRQHPEDSVSSQLHLCTVGFGKVNISAYRMIEITSSLDFPRAYMSDREQPTRLITNWKQFQEYCKDRKLVSGTAVC